MPSLPAHLSSIFEYSVKLSTIRLQNFRNIGEAALDIDKDRIFLVGPNGQGKTNLLEAIGYVSALRAFRPGDNRALIREGAGEAGVGYVVEHETAGHSEVVVRIRPRGKEAALDGDIVKRLADYLGRFPSVLFSSEDMQLIRGAPALRRRSLDLHLSGFEPGYLEALQKYHRALDSRNRLLKEGGDAGAMKAFERELAAAAATLFSARTNALAILGTLAAEFYGKISGGVEQGTITYKPDSEITTPDDFLKQLNRQKVRDVQVGSTQRGPHRDDFAFRLGEKDAAVFASEGQQRALVLALRFAQLRDARARSGVAPIVLADDVLGELDPVRRERFWQALDSDLQLFATGTSLPEIAGHGDWQVFQVEAGSFTPFPSGK